MSQRYGKGLVKGLQLTAKHLLRHPVTTQYPEQRLVPSRRTRGNELIWDKEQCSGCTTCAKTCPQGVIRIVTSGSGQVSAPCSLTCPAHINIPRYVGYIAEGKPEQALAVIREKIPFPSVCGRVCFHPCETKCQREQVDEPISIRVLKRYASKHDTGEWKQKQKLAPKTEKRVAVVGAGPCGLTAAFYLAKLGHSVTVFEALPEPGGMMRFGIPDYRLPKDVLKDEINEILSLGVELKKNTRIESLDKLSKDGYNAIFLAVGAHEGMKMGVEGEDSPGVMDCASFLREVSLDKNTKIGKRVAVVGGGNAAIDSARTALRLGAEEVTLIYRRSRAEMPANPEEIVAAEEEGIKTFFLANPTKITSKAGELWMECIRMQLGEPDASGRRRPEPVKGSEFTMSFDNIIAAIGQRPHIPEQFKVKIGKGNTIEANKDTLATSLEGVYAGGDAMTGPASVIGAIAAGRQAAISIDKYLGGKGDIDEQLAEPAEKEPPLTRMERRDRVHPEELPAKGRTTAFTEVESILTTEEAVKEASRCLKCNFAYTVGEFGADMGYCIFCGLCVEACPRDALFLGYDYERSKYRRSELELTKEELVVSDGKRRSGFCRPKIEKTLPQQTLLVDRSKLEKK